jgi:hypothetical protein
MSQYAATTTVSVEKSRAEIETILHRYGADQFTYGRDDQAGMAMIQFRAKNRHVRYILKLPNPKDIAFWQHSRGRRTPEAAYKEWEQACRQKWRALALCIKAKLEAVASEISEFEDEFLAHIVLPGGVTAGQWLRPQIEQAYLTEEMPRSLLSLPAPE